MASDKELKAAAKQAKKDLTAKKKAEATALEEKKKRSLVNAKVIKEEFKVLRKYIIERKSAKT